MIFTGCFFGSSLAVLFSVLGTLPIFFLLALASTVLDLVVLLFASLFVSYAITKWESRSSISEFEKNYVNQSDVGFHGYYNKDELLKDIDDAEENIDLQFFDYEADTMFCKGIEDETEAVLVDSELLEDVDFSYFESLFYGEDQADEDLALNDLMRLYDRYFFQSLLLETEAGSPEGLEDIGDEVLMDKEILDSIDESLFC